MTAITDCTRCPLYIKTADAKDLTGRPYFGMCGASGRFINATAAPTLPGSDACPLTEATVEEARTIESVFIDAPSGTFAIDATAPFIGTVLSGRDRDKGGIGYGIPMTDHEAASVAGGSEGWRLGTAPDSCKRCVFFTDKAQGASVAPATPAARYDYCARKGTLIEPGTRTETAAACTVGVKGTPSVPDTAIRLPLYTSAATAARTTGAAMTAPTFTEAEREALATMPDPDVFGPGVPPTGVEVERKGWSDPESDPMADVRDAMRRTRVAPTETPATVDEMRDLAKRIYAAAAPTTTADSADAAAEASAAVLAALAKGTGLTDTVAREIAAEAVTESEREAPLVMGAPREATADGKPLPKRPKTGMVFDADTYDLTEALAAWVTPVLPTGALGVVAIRSTTKASNVVYLPVYDTAALPAEVAADVPAADGVYLDHSDLLFRMAVAYATDSVCALWGDAGVGKTEGAEHLARLTRQPFRRISIKWATQVDDLMGRWTLKDGTMEWLEGRFVKAWRHPYVVCVDEPNVGKDEVWQALRAPFDGARLLVLDEKDGEVVPRHPGCRVYAAMNPSWDARFTGTQPLNDADLDRMQHIMVPYPDTATEKAIMALKSPWLTEEQVTGMLNTARDIRAAVAAQTIRISFGVRKMLRWADAMRYLDPQTAFKQACTAHMHPDEARILNDVCDAYFK